MITASNENSELFVLYKTRRYMFFLSV
jgi:hypothetical protein